MANRLMGNTYFDLIKIRIRTDYSSHEVEQQLMSLLTLHHGNKDCFIFYNMDDIFVQAAEKTTRTLQLFLTLVEVISLVVGGIGGDEYHAGVSY